MNAMNHLAFSRISVRRAGCLLAAALLILPATLHAQGTRIFVSGKGSDANDGSLAKPKRFLEAAHNAAPAGGEIVILDSAVYGTLNITKSIDIKATDGAVGYILLNTTGGAITINAAAADTVNLRGLNLKTNLVGELHGIYAQSVGTLNVQDCTVQGFGYGIDFAPAANASLLVDHCTMRNCAIGLRGQPANFAMGTIRDSTMIGNNVGASFTGFNRFAVIDSTITANGTGLRAVSGNSHVLLKHCQVVSNSTGLSSAGSSDSLLRVEECSVSFHTQSFGSALVTKDGGRILSRGNNALIGNHDDGSFTGTYTPL